MAHTTTRLNLTGLSCAGCVARVEQALKHVKGVDTASVNFANRSAEVTHDASLPLGDLTDALSQAGYPAEIATLSLAIDGMSCASCVGRVEKALQHDPGVLSAQVNLASETAQVEYLANLTDPSRIAAQATRAGYPAQPPATGAVSDTPSETQKLTRATLFAALLALPVFVIEMGGHMVPALHHYIHATIGTTASHLIQFALTTAILAGPGRAFYRKGIPSLLRGAPDMNALVALGTGAAYGFSVLTTFAPGLLPSGTANVYFEAAAVIVVLILLGRLLEARAKGRTGAAIRKLVGLQPQTARIERDGTVTEHPIADIQPGDIVHVRPGARIPCDGTVLTGTSFVDESMITGEPLPVAKDTGAPLTGGTINGTGALRFTATHVGQDTVLAQIIRMVEQAQGAKLPVQALVDRITLWFVPAVLTIAALTIAAWLMFGPAPALPFALVAGVSVLIIACPCAMGLATPTSIMVGTGRAAEMGVLFRKGDALQRLQDVKAVAFDKTGTLTIGKPHVTRVIALTGDEDDLLRLCAGAESASEHPLARAVTQAATETGLTVPPAENVQAVAGLGLTARVDGKAITLGSARFLQSRDIDTSHLTDQAQSLAETGHSLLFVALDAKLAGLLAVSDAIKPEAREVVETLTRQGLTVAMISGDTEPAAKAIAAQLGISHVTAGVLPDGKVAALRDLQHQLGPVAFVGDGINDAPALAAADVGIALGTGTDIAVETADVVLMSGEVTGVANALHISTRTMRNIRQNLVWAFGYNTLLIPVAAGVLYPFGGPLLSPVLAAGAMALSSVFVVTNALRLRRVRPSMDHARTEPAPGTPLPGYTQPAE